jgi:hypothetical protein
MEVKLNNSASPVSQVLARVIKSAKTQPSEAVASFARSDALNRTLAATPDVRPDVVARARQLVAQPAYPPKDVLERIARLISSEISGT